MEVLYTSKTTATSSTFMRCNSRRNRVASEKFWFVIRCVLLCCVRYFVYPHSGPFHFAEGESELTRDLMLHTYFPPSTAISGEIISVGCFVDRTAICRKKDRERESRYKIRILRVEKQGVTCIKKQYLTSSKCLIRSNR
jgi:hypothetical protein